MKKNNKRKGIWIPIEMIENKELDWTNKALLSEIYSLHEQKKGCIASDQHFANLLGFKHPSTAQKRVDKLVELNLIHKKVVYENRKIIGKILTPLIPIEDIGKIISLKNNSTDQEPTNSSEGNNGVVPVSPGSSSPENTINTQKNTLNINTSNNINSNNISGPISGPKEKFDQFVANSTSISKHLFNSPEAIKKFENSLLEYSNENNYSYSMIFHLLKEDLKILGNWEERLLQTGIEEFLYDMENYHKGDPNEMAFVYVFAIRTLNNEQSE
jgi:hypothetical protein